MGYGSKTPLQVTAKFPTRITTKKGAMKETWVYVVHTDDKSVQPLMGDTDATDLGFLTFTPEGREPTEREVRINVVINKQRIGQGAMLDTNEPEITEQEKEECLDVINDPKYESIAGQQQCGHHKKKQ